MKISRFPHSVNLSLIRCNTHSCRLDLMVFTESAFEIGFTAKNVVRSLRMPVPCVRPMVGPQLKFKMARTRTLAATKLSCDLQCSDRGAGWVHNRYEEKSNESRERTMFSYVRH